MSMSGCAARRRKDGLTKSASILFAQSETDLNATGENAMEIQRADNPGEDTLHARDEANADRRKFLAALGRFSVVTPPTITLLLSTALASEAIAQSGGRGHPWRRW